MPFTLHCIVQDNVNEADKDTLELFLNAAKVRGIDVIVQNPDTYDFTNIKQLGKGDLLYRITTSPRSRALEVLFIGSGIATFYNDLSYGVTYRLFGSVLINSRTNLPIAPTIFDFTNNRLALKRYAKYLGGFPIIIKILGGSRGVGVIRVDSQESLFSISDVLMEQNRTEIIMRKYIDYVAHARLIVLGKRVVSSIEYKRVSGDFRSNAGAALSVVPRVFDKTVEQSAVEAVKSMGYEFGGVDILIDENGRHFITEVNFPCFFARAERATGVDIAGMLIDHLLEKSQSA
jgi:hypothetical protein